MTTRVHCNHCDAVVPQRDDSDEPWYGDSNHKIVDAGWLTIAAWRGGPYHIEKRPPQPKEYDLCDKCWATLMEWLKGRGLP